jgi:dihydroxyacetone kinase-like protein
MKKIINCPENFVNEMLDGIFLAHGDKLTFVNNDKRCIVKINAGTKKKVALATGGGSGHLPLFLGYVGEGLLDGASVGGVFQSPSADQMLEVTKAIDTGMGVLYIYGNYGGDIMNFDMAAEMAEFENIKVESYAAGDDVASAPKGEEHKRRGVAGIFYIFKCAGAMAETGADLAEVKRITEKVGDSVRSIGVALSPVIVPEVGKPSFTIEDGKMEIGMGIHGEPGIRKGDLLSADEITEEMLEKILDDMDLCSGDEVSVLMNGLGSTPQEELYVSFRKSGRSWKIKALKM